MSGKRPDTSGVADASGAIVSGYSTPDCHMCLLECSRAVCFDSILLSMH